MTASDSLPPCCKFWTCAIAQFTAKGTAWKICPMSTQQLNSPRFAFCGAWRFITVFTKTLPLDLIHIHLDPGHSVMPCFCNILIFFTATTTPKWGSFAWSYSAFYKFFNSCYTPSPSQPPMTSKSHEAHLVHFPPVLPRIQMRTAFVLAMYTWIGLTLSSSGARNLSDAVWLTHYQLSLCSESHLYRPGWCNASPWRAGYPITAARKVIFKLPSKNPAIDPSDATRSYLEYKVSKCDGDHIFLSVRKYSKAVSPRQAGAKGERRVAPIYFWPRH
jgi:hypothetical protein